MAKVIAQPIVLIAFGITLCACAEPSSSTRFPAARTAVPAAAQVVSTTQQVGYDTLELQRRLVDVASGLRTFSDLSPHALQKRLGLDLPPDPKRPQATAGIGALSNGWVYQVQAWQATDTAPPPGPVQFYFFPGSSVDPKWWGGARCFLDSGVLLEGLKAQGFAVDGQRDDGGLQTTSLSRSSPTAVFTVVVGDHLANPIGEGSRRCLRKLTLTAKA